MIEQMTHVAIMAKTADRDKLLSALYQERGFHVQPIDERGDEWIRRFNCLPDQTQELDSSQNRINSAVSFCQEFNSDKPGFIDAMLPLKTVGTRADIDAAVQDVDIDVLYDEVSRMRAEMERDQEKIARLQSHKASVEQFAFLGEDLPRLRALKHVELVVVAVSGQGGKAFLLDDRIGDKVVAQELFADQMHAYYVLVAADSDADTLRAIVDDHGLNVVPLPEVTRGAGEEIADLERKIAHANRELDGVRAEANKFADRWLREASLAAGYWESERNLAVARQGMAESSHLFVARGYTKTENVDKLSAGLAAKVPGVAVVSCEAPAEEEPPISMKWNRWISPAALLVKMYGLPSYKSIDPTPFVASIFFIFVGICLGDAVYGLLLIGLMAWLKRKYRDQAHLQDFFQCFTYCGISAVVVGFFTGSWLGDLTSIIPGMGGADRIRTMFALIDPIKDSQLALYIAIGIGVATQFYGMILRVYRDWRRGDRMGAFSDGILWIGFLLFVILGAATGSAFFWALLLLCVVGLVLTQGREQKGIIPRLLVGLISLYGIVGAYGASAILGDLISYARLMALCLTGAALGSTFNMLGRLSTDIPAVGVIVAVMIIVGGHLMSFFLNLLGGFVHSARLIMLEFFGRFYEAGGYAYKPYGFDSSSVLEKKRD